MLHWILHVPHLDLLLQNQGIPEHIRLVAVVVVVPRENGSLFVAEQMMLLTTLLHDQEW